MAEEVRAQPLEAATEAKARAEGPGAEEAAVKARPLAAGEARAGEPEAGEEPRPLEAAGEVASRVRLPAGAAEACQ